MPRTNTNLLTHCIFSTKDRARSIAPEMERQLHAYLGGIVRQIGGKAFAINGTADHVHMLVALPPTVTISEAMRVVKSNSSAWAHERGPERAKFAWQAGFGAFSVSRSNVPAVAKCIGQQKAHHRKLTFQEEFIELLRRHKIDHDERYLWV